jgi:chemotaxis protein CheC
MEISRPHFESKRLALSDLRETQLEGLKEMSHAGMVHAAAALSQLLGHPLTLVVSRVSVLSLADIPGQIGGEEERVAGLYFRIRGDVQGSVLILLPWPSVLSVIRVLTDKETSQPMALAENERSVLKELANILTSAYLTALSNLLGVLLIPSIPGFALDMVSAVVDGLLIERDQPGGVALVIETRFENPESGVVGRLILLPDPESLPAFLDRLPPNSQ